MKATDSDSGIKEASAAADVKGQMELRVKVAELLGWTDFGYRPVNLAFDAFVGWPPNAEESTGHHLPVPDYPNDFNACHEFEEAMTEEQRYNYTLTLLRLPRIGYGGTEPMACCFPVLHATAEQRCLAFVKTMEAASVPNVPDSSSASSSPKSAAAVTPTKGTN
jgi:hypothetical protein